MSSVAVAPLKWIKEWIKKPYLENGGHAIPDIKEKQPRLLTASLVEPLQSGSQAHMQVHQKSHYFVHSVSTRVLEVRYSCYYVLLVIPTEMSVQCICLMRFIIHMF